MSRARELSKLGNINALAVDTTDTEVGIASTVPSSTLDVRGEVRVGTTITAGIAGVITATSFSGSGANLTGLATTETVRTDTLTVAGVSTLTGAVNIDATTDSTSVSTGALIVDGGVGIAKNVYIGAGLSVAGTLTYEDVTNVDSVGLITAKSGVNVSGGQLAVGVAYSVGSAGVATAAGFVGPLTGAVTGTTGSFSSNLTVGSGITFGSAGVATFSGTSDVHLVDNVQLNFGNGKEGDIYRDSAQMIINNDGGNLKLRSTSVHIAGLTNEKHIVSNTGVGVTLFYNNSAKFETTNDGTVTTGIGTFTTNVAIDAAFGEAATDANDIVIGSTSDTQKGISIVGSTSGGVGNIFFTDGAGYKNQGYIQYRHADDEMRLRAGGADIVRLTSTKVGVGTTNPQNALHVESASNTYVQISKPDTASNILIGNANGDCIIESTGGQVKIKPNGASNKFILDTSGRLLLGASSADTDLGGYIQVVGADYGGSGILQARMAANQYGPSLDFLKSRNATWGSHTIVQDGDQLGTIQFRGDDGVNYSGGAAAIKGEVDGTPGANDLPGRLVFLTSADGVDSASERLRITSTGTFDFTNGALIEKVNITAGKLSDNTNIDLGDGMVHYFTTQETTTCTPNIRVNSSVELNDVMGLGDVITVTLVTTAAAGGYSANILIDSQTITEEWVGGSAPSAGGSDGLDVYVYTIICIHASNTGDSGFKVIANYINATN